MKGMLTDVPTQSALLKDKGIDPASGRPYVDVLATGVTQAPYTRSTEPFEIVKDTLYYVGDNEVYQALKAYNNDPAHRRHPLTMLDALTTGEFANLNEKRYEVVSYAKSDTQPGYQSIETYGPFKPGRENGEHDVAVTLLDGGKVIGGSRAEADAKLAGLQAGSTYQVDLTRASTIVVPPGRPAFRATNF